MGSLMCPPRHWWAEGTERPRGLGTPWLYGQGHSAHVPRGHYLQHGRHRSSGTLAQHLARGGVWLPRRGGDTAAISPGPTLPCQSRIWLRARANGRDPQTSSDRPPVAAKPARGQAVPWGCSGWHRGVTALPTLLPLGWAQSQPAPGQLGRKRAEPGQRLAWLIRLHAGHPGRTGLTGRALRCHRSHRRVPSLQTPLPSAWRTGAPRTG